MKRKSRAVCLAFSMLFLFGVLSLPTVVRAEEPLRIVVSILPQKYFVEKIGGERVDVSVMVAPGANPATYEPKPRQMVALSKSEIFYAIGVPFEDTWLKKFASVNPDMMIVHTEEGIEKLAMEAHYSNEADGHHGIKDPHVWLSPPLVMIQARNILDALAAVDPAHMGVYEGNYRRFITELVDLDLKIRDIFNGKGPGCRFMVFHPSWGYFAKAYGLIQVPVETEGKEPAPRKLLSSIRQAREQGLKVIFVQPQFSTKGAEKIAEAVGGRVTIADPLELDWANNLIKVAEGFKAAF